MGNKVVSLDSRRKHAAPRRQLCSVNVRGVSTDAYMLNMATVGEADLTKPLTVTQMEAIRFLYEMLNNSEVK